MNMPEAINRHHFLNKLDKEWKAIRTDNKYVKEKFPRQTFSDDLKSDPEHLVTAHKQGVPITLLGLAFPHRLENILQDIHDISSRCQKIDLSSKLKTVPAEIGNFPGLKRLDLRNNKLDKIPPEIGNLRSLEELDLGSNELASIPPEFGNLKNLRKLRLSANNFSDLPPALEEMTQLKELNIAHNQITVVSDRFSTLTGLKVLDLIGSQITDAFKGIRKLKQLETLNLSFNRLTTVSDDIGTLTGLKTLHLSGNEITAMSKEIGNLTGLQNVTLASNKLTVLPSEFGNLTQLQNADLANNKLEALPSEFGNLKRLRWADFSWNKLSTLSPDFGNLKQLRELNLRGNQFRSWPEGLGQFPKLDRLDLSDNKITQVSDALLTCGAKHIDLTGNPLSPEAIAHAMRRVKELRQQGRAAPELLLPEYFDPDQIDRLRDTHDRRLQKFHRIQFDQLVAQFPDKLRGSEDQQLGDISAIQSRLNKALGTYASDHPDIKAAREVANSMFDQSFGLRNAYANDFAYAEGFKYSPGRVLSFVMLHIERVRDNAAPDKQEEVFSTGINTLATQLAEAQENGVKYCDARQIEDTIKVISLFNEEDVAISYRPPQSEINEIVFDKAKISLPQFMAQHPHLHDDDARLQEHDDDARLQEAFCKHLTEIIPAEHKGITAKDTMDYLKKDLIPFWQYFKENALDTEEKPAATT